jgi:exopolyphosphatase/guanosine-5'-triphosphate,3'-diphosphate pyrophosphatase
VARFAAIDVGSNAMRLRVVEADRPREGEPAPSSNAWREVASQRAPVRLGRDVFLNGNLTPAAIAAASDALRRFRDAMDAAAVDVYRAVATSAVREAKNGHVLVARAEREAGVHLEVIDGMEEARLVQLAVGRRLALDERRALLVDIGGGSTELTLVERGRARYAKSLPIGTVRLLEAFVDEPHARAESRQPLVLEYVDRVLAEALPGLPIGSFEILVGTGGNIETLAQLCPTTTPDGPAIDVGRMRALLAELWPLTPGERAARWGLRPDRADVIVPAGAVLLRVAETFRAGAIVAPGVGLKEGILEELTSKHFARWDWEVEARAVEDACLRLGRRYQFDEAHGRHVATLATRLFDALAPRHGLARRERLLLHAGALLHDIGDFVRYEGHHRHGFYLIEHSDLMGLTGEERAVVANHARYHRKSPPDPSHPNFRALGREDRHRVRVLAGILRVADALDREHRQKVRDVSASFEKGKVRLRPVADEGIELEEWTVDRKADLLRDVLGVDLQLARK